jgi:hypothetical protein
MSEYLTTGCMLTCTFGTAPGIFEALPLPGKEMIEGAMTVATIEEIVPLVNIPSFVMCESLANPEVASATAAAEGVLTPMPCVPVPVSPWEPSSINETYVGIPLATVLSKCACSWAGVISVELPSEFIATTMP